MKLKLEEEDQYDFLRSVERKTFNMKLLEIEVLSLEYEIVIFLINF